MKFVKSLRVKLTVLFLLTNIIPIGIIVLVMPGYYQDQTYQDTHRLAEGTLNSLGSNIDSFFEDLTKITSIPYFNHDVMQALKAGANPASTSASPDQQPIPTTLIYKNLSESLQNTRADVVSIALLPVDSALQPFATGKYDNLTNLVPDYPFDRQPWYQKAKDAKGSSIYIGPHSQDYLGDPSSQVLSVARLIRDPDTFRPLAIILVDADTTLLEKIVSRIPLNVRSTICVFGTDQQLIYPNNPPLSKEVLQQIAHNATPIQDTGDSYDLKTQQTSIAQWKVGIFLSRSDIQAKSNWLYFMGFLFAVISFCLTLLVFFILSRWIIKPFQHMMGAMKKVQEGDLQIRIATEGEDEIALLGHAFNAMVGRLNDLIEHEYKSKLVRLSQRDAEYHALQSQIQPHFLYNILNTFIELSRFGERQALEKAIVSLSAILRYILSKDERVTLKDEFYFLQKYCNLQKLRFQEKMTFDIHCDDDLASFKVPKVLLQSLVENAITRRMEPAASPCKLHVLATLKQEDVCISIQDNGVGFDLQTQQDSPGLGLCSIQERLKMVYENASLSITSLIGGGTQVVVAIPRGA